MKPNFNHAAEKAAELLKQHGFQKPPIDPEAIAEEEGLRVYFAEFKAPHDEKTSGFFQLSEDDNGGSIYVNSSNSDNRITFTIAHELAHYILHKEYIKSNKYQPMPRHNKYDGEKPVEEIEADFFAASLLVPLKMLKNYRDFASEEELARLFFVSLDVIRNRLDLLKRHPSLAK